MPADYLQVKLSKLLWTLDAGAYRGFVKRVWGGGVEYIIKNLNRHVK